MSDELKTIKFQLMLSESEARAIDDWGFKNRIRTRAEAIRRLCSAALAFDESFLSFVLAFKKVMGATAETMDIIEEITNDKGATARELKIANAIVNTPYHMSEAILLLGAIREVSVNSAENAKEMDFFEESRKIMAKVRAQILEDQVDLNTVGANKQSSVD